MGRSRGTADRIRTKDSNGINLRMKVREVELMVWMKMRMTVMKKDDKTLLLCGGGTGEESPTGC